MTQTGQSPQLVVGIQFPIIELWYRGNQRVSPKDPVWIEGGSGQITCPSHDHVIENV